MEQMKSLKEIFALLRQNDKTGLELLYSLYYNKMYGIAFSVVKNELMTEDIVHNVMYRFMTMNSEMFPTANENTWLFSVVKNEALILLRKERKAVSFEQIGEIGIEDKSIKEYVDIDEFKSMIKSLSSERQEVVTLKILGGYTHKEIAKLLNKPIGTIQWLYNTAIRKLRFILSSIMSVILIVFGGLISMVKSFISEKSDGYGNAHVSIGGTKPQQVCNIEPYHLVLVGLVLIVIVCVFILIYKKSEKIPTKTKVKCI